MPIRSLRVRQLCCSRLGTLMEHVLVQNQRRTWATCSLRPCDLASRTADRPTGMRKRIERCPCSQRTATMLEVSLRLTVAQGTRLLSETTAVGGSAVSSYVYGTYASPSFYAVS